MPGPSAIRIAICVATFRRREQLQLLLQGIARLTFRKVQMPEIGIVVVDNDEQAGAREVCQAVSVPWPIRYAVEPRRGITYARNRAIAEAGEVDFVAFIDDDEVPSPHWLDELLWAQAEFAADVVSGPVIPRFSPDVSDWVKRGGFFDPRISTTGTLRNTCASNNVLVATKVFGRLPQFDDSFALSGAEDTNFFLRVNHAGYKIVWSQEAYVCEMISPERANVAWLLRREYQTGNGWVFCEAGVDRSFPTWISRFAKACGHVLIGSLKAILWLLMLDSAAVVRSLQRVSLGSGMLTALAGYRFQAYNTSTKTVALGQT